MILFFVRRYNDIDHTVPVIYRMAKDGFRDLEILCVNLRIDIEQDFRLKFLKDSFGIRTRYATQFFWPTGRKDQIIALATSGLYYRRSITKRDSQGSHAEKELSKVCPHELAVLDHESPLFD